MKIIVTGANGQVGSEIRAIAANYPAIQFVFLTRNELDFALFENEYVGEILNAHQPDLCINCAAYTAVDLAENNEKVANEVNFVSVVKLANTCNRLNIKLIHLSTDYVYHSETVNRPFTETEKPSPKSVYARTKFDGDVGALITLSSCVVVRTSWVYSSFGANFVKTMLRLGKEKPSLNVVIDQIGTPTYARDLAEALILIAIKMIAAPEANFGGIYHYSNEGVTSWYDFAKSIHRLANISTCNVQPIPTANYPTPAKRPPFSVLDKTKIKNVFGLTIRHWEDALADCMTRL